MEVSSKVRKKLNAPILEKRRRFRKETPLSKATQRRLRKAKRRVRSELREGEWGRRNFAESDVCERLFAECEDSIERVKLRDFAEGEFLRKHQQGNRPVIIRGLAKKWNRGGFWDWDNFYRAFKRTEFKVGEDDDENTVRLPLKTFFEYLKKNRDDSPLYLFEKDIGDKKQFRPILKNYRVPRCFREDLFSLMGQDERPPYQWFLVGPKRSGTTIHVDPLNTSAWNTSLHGYKLWILFPNEIPKWIANGRQFRKEGEDSEAIDYFANVLPRLKSSEGRQNLRYIECVQRPGETIFVPGGWWHAVLNLSDSMAVTQNFCSHFSFERIWKHFRVSRKKLSTKFLSILRKRRSSIFQRAVRQNRADRFRMKGRPAELAALGLPVARASGPESDTTTTIYSSSATTTSSDSDSSSDSSSSD